MKLILPIILIVSSAWAVDYDPKFHTKHRYNKHEQVKGNPHLKVEQRMEASETSPAPLSSTPNARKTEKPLTTPSKENIE